MELRQQPVEGGLPQHVRYGAADHAVDRAPKPVRIGLVYPEIPEIAAATCHRCRHLVGNEIQDLEVSTLAIVGGDGRIDVVCDRNALPIRIALSSHIPACSRIVRRSTRASRCVSRSLTTRNDNAAPRAKTTRTVPRR